MKSFEERFKAEGFESHLLGDLLTGKCFTVPKLCLEEILYLEKRLKNENNEWTINFIKHQIHAFQKRYEELTSEGA